MEEIGKSLPAVFKRHVRRTDPKMVEILAPLWGRVAGRAVAEHCRPVAFWSGTLTVSTPCATWASQLRQLAGEILETINRFLGGRVVRELRITLVPGPERAVPSAVPRGITHPRSPSIFTDAEGLTRLDTETARIVERSFSKYFSRGVKRFD